VTVARSERLERGVRGSQVRYCEQILVQGLIRGRRFAIRDRDTVGAAEEGR